MVRSSFIVALQTDYCKPATPVIRGDFSKFLEKPLFGTYHARVRVFSTELQNAEVSPTLLKCDSTTDVLPEILKYLITNKGNTCDGISFQHSYLWVVGQLQKFQNTLIKLSVMEFNRVLDCTSIVLFYIPPGTIPWNF